MSEANRIDMTGVGRSLYSVPTTLNLYSFFDTSADDVELDETSINILAEAFQEWILTTYPQLDDPEERFLELIMKAGEFYLINVTRIHLLHQKGGYPAWGRNPVRHQTELAHFKMFQPVYKQLLQLDGVLNVSGWASGFVVDSVLRTLNIAEKKAFKSAMLNPAEIEKIKILMDFMCDLLQHMNAHYVAQSNSNG